MRRHRYPHGRGSGGIRVHNGIRIRIRKIEAVPVGAEFILSLFLIGIVNRNLSLAKSSRFNCVF